MSEWEKDDSLQWLSANPYCAIQPAYYGIEGETMKLLVSNVGSTSLKFKLFQMPEEKVLCEARAERIGDGNNSVFSFIRRSDGITVRKEGIEIRDYAAGIRLFTDSMTGKDTGVISSVSEIERVGFKTVLSMGYYGVHELNDDVMAGMREALFVAPVHNAAYIEAIEHFRTILPGIPLIGVFETAFHTTIPFERRIYSVPFEWYERYGLVRMGYHGASHGYIAQQAKQYGKADRIISCHLGGSCSLCAILNGESVDTSFGYSLQTGIMHANRCGDADPYLVPFLESHGMSRDEIMYGLSKKGGLLGISGLSNDMRDLEAEAAAGNKRAGLAVNAFVYSIVRYIGAFYAVLGGLDQLVFTGGIGENDANLREKVCAAVSHFGIRVDAVKNAVSHSGVISEESSPVTVSIIPANEELGVARKTYNYK